MGNNIEKNHIARVTYEKTLRASPNKKSGKAATIQVFPAWGRGTASAALGCFRKQHKYAPLSPVLPIVFHAMSALSAPAGHLPLQGKAAIREYHPLKRRHITLVNLSAPKHRHPERSRGIFIALPPYARMRSHSNDTLVLPFSPFPRSRFTGMQERSLHFGPHDTQERRVVSHSFSHRFVDPSCAFGAALLEGPTRIVYNTDSSKTRNVSPR